MKIIITAFLVILSCSVSRAGERELSSLTKASLSFRLESSTIPYHYPHTVLAFLNLANKHDSDLTWASISPLGIEAEVFDAKGNQVPQSAAAASISYAWQIYRLPFGSSLDWLVSSGGLSLMGDPKTNAALVVGGRGWMLPLETLSSYSVVIRVRGIPSAHSVAGIDKQSTKVLFETARTNIVIR